MKIVMFTNTYLPHVGGVANSVDRFTHGFRRKGNQVLVVAPVYGDDGARRANVFRIRALQHFNGSDFSVVLPISPSLNKRLKLFEADIFHSHHPYLVGDMALRQAAVREVPLVFTYHTMYEHYTQYVPLGMERLKKFVVKLSTGYANMCDHVIAPSESLADILRRRGVTAPISVIPTGVNTREFMRGNSEHGREMLGVAPEAFLIGHVSRLASEKNPDFLMRAIVIALNIIPKSEAVIIGDGPARAAMENYAKEHGLAARIHFTGTLKGRELVNAYHAMDVFAFASLTETQGMVLTEAMAASVPVVALDASGVREVVNDGENGRLVPNADAMYFARALEWVSKLNIGARRTLQQRARATAREFSLENSVKKMLNIYEELVQAGPRRAETSAEERSALLRTLKIDWDLWANRLNALSSSRS